MAMNSLDAMLSVFERDDNEIFVDTQTAERALIPLQRMLDFRKATP
jgi:quinolinate synthase